MNARSSKDIVSEVKDMLTAESDLSKSLTATCLID